MHEYDKCGKYQIQHHGDSILRMARAPAIVSWKPVQTELVQHRRLPDGLIEVLHLGEENHDTYLLEAEIEALMTVLVRRFGAQAEALEGEIRAISDEARLKEMIGHAATCRSLAAFRKKLKA